MAKTVTVDRVKVIAEMARQNLTGEELAQKAGTGNSAIYKMRKGQPVWRTTAVHVSRALGVSVESLMEECQPKLVTFEQQEQGDEEDEFFD